jgi:DNA-binding MarR family transcriptional regulator
MTTAEATPSVRESLDRIELASARHRAAVARVMRLSENDVLAMTYLRRAGRLTPTALGRLLSLTSGGTTALVQRLEREGHVVRDRHPGDGRSTLLRLAETAEARPELTESALDDALAASLDALPKRERGAVVRFLADAARLVEEHADRASAAASGLDRLGAPEAIPSLPH